MTKVKLKIKRRWGRTTLPYPNGLNGSTAANTRYTATVTLTANTGFTFNGLSTATINGNAATVTNNTGNQVTLSYQFPATLELPTTPPEDVELRVYVDGWEMYDQGFMSLSGFCAVLLEWDVLPSNSVVTGEVTITVDDPDAFYIEQDGLNFWLHPQVSHQDFLVTLSIPTTVGVLTKEFWIGVFPIHWRALVDFMPIGIEDGVTTIYTYDVFNRLIGVNGVGVSGNAVDAQYTYRPDGLRINKTVNGVRTTHLWDGANIVAELDNDNNIKDVYIRGIGLIKNGQNQWFLFNARGDVVALTDEVGNVIREYRYDAFGNELDPCEYDTNPWRFTGEYFDRETGTIYLRMRHYNPRTGRFMTVDPFFRTNNRASLNIYTVRQTANLYAYVANNPVRFIDPNGLWLRDFANAAGTNDINWNASTRTATLTINGITHSFRDGANGNIHTTGSRAGIMEVDQAYFNRIFGLGTSISSASGPGVWFTSADAAATDFVRLFNPPTHTYNREWGGFIYRGIMDGRSFYTYRDTRPGGHADVVWNLLSGPASIRQDGVWAHAVAWVHTHPSCYCHRGNYFSSQDIWLVNGFLGFETVYLGAPNGHLYAYDRNGGLRIVATGLPSATYRFPDSRTLTPSNPIRR